MTLCCRKMLVSGHARLVLVVSLGAVGSTVLDLLVLSGNFTHALVELVELSLDALRHGGGGGAQIHRIEGESGAERCVDDNIGGCSDADGSHERGGEERREGEHDDGDGDFGGDGIAMMRDKKNCMINVREGKEEEKAQCEDNTRCVEGRPRPNDE
jgi:hypothetical protein